MNLRTNTTTVTFGRVRFAWGGWVAAPRDIYHRDGRAVVSNYADDRLPECFNLDMTAGGVRKRMRRDGILSSHTYKPRRTENGAWQRCDA